MEAKTYVKIDFRIPGTEQREILTAFLTSCGWDALEEHPDGLSVFIPGEDWDEHDLNELLAALPFDVDYKTSEIKEKNWNSLWERQITPLNIEDQLYIRTGFHPPAPEGKIEIIIDPKMSFGTGHHPTTELMLRMLLEEQAAGKTLIDMGTGTGVLSILAEKLGAKPVFAIDNDPWAFENAKENVLKNHCRHIQVIRGDATSLQNLPGADIFLANINRNIILKDLSLYVEKINKGGSLMLSGFYKRDKKIILDRAVQAGLKPVRLTEKNDWLGMKFVK